MFGYYVSLLFFRSGIHHIFPVCNEGFLWFVALYYSYCLIAFIGIVLLAGDIQEDEIERLTMMNDKITYE